MNVVLIVLDGVGARWVDRDYMPTLHGWGVEGVMRPGGATSVLCSSTYPNFASIVTGALPTEHGMFANEVVVDGVTRHTSEVGPKVPTFLDENSEVVVGDHHLIGVMAAQTSGRHWPPSGGIPDGVGLDAFGYVSDEEVTAGVVDAVERRPELLFVQLNGPDTAAHLYGPDSDEAIGAYRSLDLCLAIIDSAIRPHWDDTLLLITSDHDQETVDLSKTIDLGSLAMERGVEVTVLNEGSAAVLVGPESDQSTWFEDIPGVEETHMVGGDTRLVFSQPDWWFSGAASPPLPGAHGGLRTRSTVAVATGSKQAFSRLSPVLGRARFGAEDWHDLVQRARSDVRAAG
jgi:predicted AlkP superfamily pyrophosphatase or phosphodiesterase